MSLDFKIAVLLAQLKDDPRFEAVSTSMPVLTAVGSQDEPLLKSFTGNSATLSSFSSNTPIFLDLRLDLFHVIKLVFGEDDDVTKTFAKTNSVVDLIATAKTIRDKLNAKEKVSFDLKTKKETKVNALEVKKLELEKGFIENKFQVKEIVQLLRLGKLEFPYDSIISKNFSKLKTLRNLSTKGSVDASHILFDRRRPPFEEFVKAQDSILHIGFVPKPMNFKEEIFTSFKHALKTIKPRNSKTKVSIELDPFKVTKGFSERTRITEFTLPVKIVTPREHVRTNTKNKSKVFLSEEDKTKIQDFRYFKTTKRIFDSGKTKSNIFFTLPGNLKYQKTTISPKDFQRLKVTKPQEILLKVNTQVRRKAVKGVTDKGNIKNFLTIFPLNVIIKKEDASFKAEERKSFITSKLVKVKAKSKHRLKFITDFNNDSSAFKNTLIFPPVKQKIFFSRGGLSDEAIFDRTFRLESLKDIRDIKDSIFTVKPRLSIAGIKSKKVFPIRPLLLPSELIGGSIKKELLFGKGIIQEGAMFNAGDRSNFVKKPIIDLHKLKVILRNPFIHKTPPITNIVEQVQVVLSDRDNFTRKGLIDETTSTGTDKERKQVILGPTHKSVKSFDIAFTPAKAFIFTEIFGLKDFKTPFASKAKVNKVKLKLEDRNAVSRETLNTAKTSMKGTAFIRDEEYTTGAYFLEPYVATVPPGRSRQF